MTKKPKAKKDANGRFIKNGARAKAGLNKVILASAWGRVKSYVSYKAQRAGKLAIEVPAHHTSQACSQCGHTHPDNRQSQAEFVCQCCGYVANADYNASQNIRQRGVALILSCEYREKESKRTMRLGKKKGSAAAVVGVESSEFTLGEITVSRSVGNDATHGSENQETPAITFEV